MAHLRHGRVRRLLPARAEARSAAVEVPGAPEACRVNFYTQQILFYLFGIAMLIATVWSGMRG